MSLYLSLGSEHTALTSQELQSALCNALNKLGARHRVLAVPPDITRLHSHAGDLTRFAYKFYGERLQAILPAVGTHKAMTPAQLTQMFGDVPHSLFRNHDWRKDVVTLGEVPSEFVYEQSEQKLNYSWPAEVNRLVVNGGFDLILSIGQVVPHEVIGMANYNKNILVGTGGPLSIGRSHFLGAVYGMERIMGRADNPVRRVLNYASEHFLTDLPIVYALTVIGPEREGLFVGDDIECFSKAAALSLQQNFVMLDKPIR